MSGQIKTCPHCGQSIKVLFQADIQLELPGGETEPGDWREGLTQDQIAFVNAAREEGILEAFECAVRRAKQSEVPKSMERFLLTFLRTVQVRTIPEWALRYYIRVYKNQRIAFFSAQGIGLVTVDGEIRQFVPLDLVAGKKLPGSSRGRLDADPQEFEVWVRTRFGYVPAKCKEMLKAMQKRAAGEFAHPRI